MSNENDEMIEYTIDELKAFSDTDDYDAIDNKDYWLPKSICDLDRTNMIIEVPKWLAIEKELE